MSLFWLTVVGSYGDTGTIFFFLINPDAQAREAWEKDSHEMRYKRLQHLLQKSNIYSKFLLTKMEQQQNEVRRAPAPIAPWRLRWALTLSFVCIQEKLKKEKTDKKAKKVRQLSGKKTLFRLKIIVLIPDFHFRRSRKMMLICQKVIIVVIVLLLFS